MSSQNRHRMPRRATLCAAILTGLALQAHAAEPSGATAKSASSAPSRQVTFTVKAGPTLDVLKAIAEQAGVTINADPTAAGRQTSPAVTGKMTVQQAILRAIDGTGLSLGEGDSGTFTVAVFQSLDVVHVYAQRDKAETRFKADRSDTATRSGADLSEIPQSVTIITSKVLETQQTRTLLDALKNVSGLSFSESPQSTPKFRIRALDATVMSNGLADPNAAQSDAFTVERVEVLKGPQAILSGGDSMGGGVNIVTKKPQAESLQSFLLQYGSHGDATVAGDVTGMVGDEKRLSYRVIGSAAKANSSPGGYDGRDNYSLSPQLRWKDASTDIIVGSILSKSHQPVPNYTFAADGVILPKPAMRLSAEKDGFDNKTRKFFYQLEHKLTSDVTLISRMQYTDDELEQHMRSPGGFVTDEENPDVQSVIFFGTRSLNRQKTFAGDHYARFNFDTGPIGHKLSVGVNHSKLDITLRQWSADPVTAQVYPAAPVSFPPINEAATFPALLGKYPSAQAGVYAQDLMNWGNWNLLLNVRRTKYTMGPTSSDFLDGGEVFGDPKVKTYETTPGAGLIYNIGDNTSVYASYQEGFQPQTGLSCQNTMLPPQRSKNKEVGAKFDLLNGKLGITASAFDMQVSNSLEYNVIDNCYNLRGGTKTKGFELDVQGEVTKGLSAILNYTYSKARDPGDPERLFAGLPRNKVSLWGTYALSTYGYAGWSVGLGVTASSRSEGSDYTFNRFRVPGQAQWDFSVFYDNAGWSVTAGVKNVFDKLIYDVSTSPMYVPIKDGRNFMLSVKKTFN